MLIDFFSTEKGILLLEIVRKTRTSDLLKVAEQKLKIMLPMLLGPFELLSCSSFDIFYIKFSVICRKLYFLLKTAGL